jgi:alcohol dehydrogenase class IV
MSEPDVSNVVAGGLSVLPEWLTSMGSRRLVLITGQSGRHVERLQALLADFELETFSRAKRHVPEAIVAQASEMIGSFGVDTVISLGGGSAIGLCKALRLTHTLRFVAIPTTYSGSELTDIYGISSGGTKTTGRDARVRPDAVVYDVSLTLDMPKTLTVTSLMNALAHPLSTLQSPALSPEARDLCFRAIEVLYSALTSLVDTPKSREGRTAAFEGAALAAKTLEFGSIGLHHKLVHQLGGRFDLDHSGLHSVLLPHSVRRLRAEAPALLAEIETRLNVNELELQLFDILLRSGAAPSLETMGVSDRQYAEFLQSNSELPTDLLRAAFLGERPSGS